MDTRGYDCRWFRKERLHSNIVGKDTIMERPLPQFNDRRCPLCGSDQLYYELVTPDVKMDVKGCHVCGLLWNYFGDIVIRKEIEA